MINTRTTRSSDRERTRRTKRAARRGLSVLSVRMSPRMAGRSPIGEDVGGSLVNGLGSLPLVSHLYSFSSRAYNFYVFVNLL